MIPILAESSVSVADLVNAPLLDRAEVAEGSIRRAPADSFLRTDQIARTEIVVVMFYHHNHQWTRSAPPDDSTKIAQLLNLTNYVLDQRGHKAHVFKLRSWEPYIPEIAQMEK